MPVGDHRPEQMGHQLYGQVSAATELEQSLTVVALEQRVEQLEETVARLEKLIQDRG